jgi:hypothetical protein
MNTALGQAVTSNMQAHIQASMNKANRDRRQQDPKLLAQDAKLQVEDASQKQELDSALGAGSSKRSVGGYFKGYDYRERDRQGKMLEEAAPAPAEAPKKPSKKKKRTVKLPGGVKGTITAKEGNKVRVINRDTREEKWWDINELELIQEKGLDPLMGLT